MFVASLTRGFVKFGLIGFRIWNLWVDACCKSYEMTKIRIPRTWVGRRIKTAKCIVYLNTSINQLRLPLSTLHAEMCCWKHTISTVGAIHVESGSHEELRHVGLTPRALCELMSREQVSQNYFAAVKCILPWMKMILPWMKMIFPWWNWFCRIVKLILP